MSYAQTIQKLEARIAKVKAKMVKQEEKHYVTIAKKYGHATVDEFIKALAPYASPVMKGRINGGSAKAGAAAAAKPGKKQKRARIDETKRSAIVADLKAGELTAAVIATKHGVSMPSVNMIKKAAGLVKKR